MKLLLRIKYWFGWYNSSSLDLKSNDVFSIFTKAADELGKVEGQIAIKHAEHEKTAARIAKEQEALTTIKVRNAKVAEKLKGFVQD